KPPPAALGGLRARAPGIDRRQRQKPPGLIGILAVPRKAAKSRGVEIAAQRHGWRHGKPPRFAPLNHNAPFLGIPRVAFNESQALAAGIRRHASTSARFSRTTSRGALPIMK